jgi:phosphoketolase
MTHLSEDLLRRIDAYWRAANHLCVGQIYLYDNPLLCEPLAPSHVKRLLGHWGTTPGQNFVYLEHLGIRLDPERNARHASMAGVDGRACTVRIVPTDEALVIARHTRRVLEAAAR